MSKSNCTKVHPGGDPGPCSAPKCGKFDPSNRYVHFCQKVLDQPEFTDYVYRQYKITDTDCICRRCERTFKRSFLKFKAGEPDEASDAKRACTDNEDNTISAFAQTYLIIELKLTVYLFSKLLMF
jgi:hypothetical protein